MYVGRSRAGPPDKEVRLQIGATFGNFLVIGLIAITAVAAGLAAIELWANSSLPGASIPQSLVSGYHYAFNAV